MTGDTSMARSPEPPEVGMEVAAAGLDPRRRTRRKLARMTPAKLRAQRANARRSTGPRTVQGRRRAAMNRLRLRLGCGMRSLMGLTGAGYSELQRLWHDLLAIFWFVEPVERIGRLELAAWLCWFKLTLLRDGCSRPDYLNHLDAEIERFLAEVIERYAFGRHDWNWKTTVRKEIGKDALSSRAALRAAVEWRLNRFHTGGAPPGQKPRAPETSQQPRKMIIHKDLDSDRHGECPETDPEFTNRSKPFAMS